MNRLFISLAALVLALLLPACGPHDGPTTVESIQLMSDDGGKPGAAVESIKSTERVFHAEITLDVGKENKVTVELLAVDTPEGKNVSVITKDYELGGIENAITMTYSLPRDWPAGTYRINVSTGGKLLTAKEFKIQ